MPFWGFSIYWWRRRSTSDAVAVYSDLERNGFFSSSTPLLDQFVENTVWSAKNNHAALPTDCPTRERHGWTGDAQARAGYRSVYGLIESGWEKTETGWRFTITVPANCRATVCLPDGSRHRQGPGTQVYPIEEA